MDILRSVLGSAEPAPVVSSAETIERLVDRVTTSTLLEDRRDACRALKAMSRKFRLEVGAQGLPTLINVLKTDGTDTEIISYVLDTLCNICSTEDFDEEVVDEERDDVTGVGEGFSEMLLKDKSNISLLLGYLEEFDFKVRRPSVQLLTDLLTNCPRDAQAQILESHVGVSRLMDVLGETREVLRNDALILLFKVTKGNANLQKIVAFENAFDKLFEILEAEGWTDGGIVAEDCLRLLLNLLRNNASNQTFFKEGSYIARIKPGLDVIETEDYGWDAQKVANMLHLLQLVRTLVSPSNPAGVTSSCQQATASSHAMDQLTDILLASGIPADVLTETINTLAEVVRGNNANQVALMKVSAPSEPPRPAIILLLMSMVNEKQPFSLRCAVLYCFQSYLFKNSPGQASIVSSLLPTSEQTPDISAGQLLCGGLFSPDPISTWLCCAAMSHIFLDSDNMRTELLRVQLSTVAGSPPVSLLNQILKILQHTPHLVARYGLLQLLCSWLAGCPPAVSQLLQTKDTLSFLLNQIGSNEHDEKERLSHGLCSVLLGLCVLHNDGSVSGNTAEDITNLVEKRIGSDVFLDKIGDIPKHESYIRALKSPQLRCGSTNDLTFDHMFCELFRSVDRDITRIMVKKAVSPMTNGDNVETGDVSQYKNFIRDQDIKMQQYVEANNLLHVESTNLRTQYEEVYGTVQQLRDQNAILQAQAINNLTSSVNNDNTTSGVVVSEGDLKFEDQEKRLKQQEEYIQELEARIIGDEKSSTEVNENFGHVMNLSKSQALELTNLKQQLEGMRGIIMHKDEEMMQLKNDLPLRKSNAPVDRFENMFMTSLEVEAHKKSTNHLELELKNEEIVRLVKKHDEEIRALEKERDEIEKELLNTRHKVDALEELTKDLDKDAMYTLEVELRDTRCKLEELQDLRDSKTLDEIDSTQLEIMLKESEAKLVSTVEALDTTVADLTMTREQLNVSQTQVATVNQELGDVRQQLISVTEQVTLCRTQTEEKCQELIKVSEELKEEKEHAVSASSEQDDLLVMLTDQEEKLTKFKQQLRDLGQEVVSDADDLEEDDLT